MSKLYNCRYCLKPYRTKDLVIEFAKTKHFGIIRVLVCENCRELIKDHLVTQEDVKEKQLA